MAIIYAAPTRRPASPPRKEDPYGDMTWAFDLQTAVGKARPGDAVILLPGVYTSGVALHRSGTANEPIILRPAIPGTVMLDGLRAPTDKTLGGIDVLDEDFAFLRLFKADHWIITGLQFRNCWPSCIFMRSARHITIRDCAAEGGRFFTYLRQSPEDPTHHITLQGCHWVQDPGFDMWRGTLTWNDVKGYTMVDATYLNGAFLGGFDVAGRIVVRDCDIRHAFNGIRLDMRGQHVDGRPISQRNRDVAIFDNRFSFIRDNAVEPEVGAQNWRVFNNQFYAVHGVISLDNVASRDLFIIGNTVLNDHRPGVFRVNGDDAQPGQGGKFFKFLRPKDGHAQPRKGLWSLYNSLLMRSSYVKKGVTGHVHDAYSLMGMLPQWWPQSKAKVRDPFKGLKWDNVRIEGMVSDARDFPDDYRDPAGTLEGTGVEQVFAPAEGSTPSDPDMAQALGGWDGVLTPRADVAALRSRELRLDPVAGDMLIPGDLPLGAQDISAFGLGHWREAWPDGSPVDGASA